MPSSLPPNMPSSLLVRDPDPLDHVALTSNIRVPFPLQHAVSITWLAVCFSALHSDAGSLASNASPPLREERGSVLLRLLPSVLHK